MQKKPSEAAEMLEPAQRLALAYAPSAARDAWAALFMLEKRLAETARPGREPLMIQLRLSWWRDQLGEPSAKWPVSEPVLGNLKAWNDHHGALTCLVDGWEAYAIGEEDASEHGSDGTSELDAARVEAFVALARLLNVDDLEPVRLAARQLIDPSRASDQPAKLPRSIDRKSTRLNSSHIQKSRMPSSA